MKVELLTHTQNPDKLIAAAAKLCYAKSDIGSLMDNLTEEKIDSFLNTLSGLGHESPVEHASFTFGIEGVSRALLAQITRHRIASFSVQSQRYVRKTDFEYITPPAIAANEEAMKVYLEAMQKDAEAYDKLCTILTETEKKRLIDSGMDEKTAQKTAEKTANEDARFVLPNSCDTRIIMTMNVRSLYNFFNLRCCNRAQWEIKELAWEMLRLCREVSPLLFAKAGPSCVKGACREGKMSCGKMAEIRERSASLNAK